MNYMTPLAVKLVEQLGVDVDRLQGTGPDGRVTPDDVRRAAGVQPRAEARAASTSAFLQQVAASSSTPSADVKPSASKLVPGAQVKVDPYARNPLVDDARQSMPTYYAEATKRGPAPTAFTSGDLPIFLASGADPAALLKLPWQARHYAATVDAQELARLFEELGGDGAWQADAYATATGCLDYRDRVTAWLAVNPMFVQPR